MVPNRTKHLIYGAGLIKLTMELSAKPEFDFRFISSFLVKKTFKQNIIHFEYALTRKSCSLINITTV